MPRFRQMRSLQSFATVHVSVHNHFNLEPHLYSREDFKENRNAALLSDVSLPPDQGRFRSSPDPFAFV